MSKITSLQIRLANADKLKLVLATVALSVCFTAHAQGKDNSPAQKTRALSRAEVIADLALWRRAGVDRYAMSMSYGVETEAYQAAYQEYLRLRNSEEFQMEVQKFLDK